MNELRRSAFASFVSVVLIAALGLAAGLGQPASGRQREAEKSSSPRALAGKEAGRPEESGAPKNRTLGTIAIVGGIAAAVLVAVLLLRKKDKPAPTATTTTVPPTTTVPATTTIIPDTGSIQANSNPPGARIFLDGADTGKSTPSLLTGVTVGAHTVKLTLARYQDWSSAVAVAKDQAATVTAALAAGDFRESFDAGGAAFWRPATGNWTVGNGIYSTSAFPPVNFAASEYTLGDYGDFTLEVRGQVLRPNGGSGRMYGIIFRGAPNLGKYYLFQVTPGGASPLWDVFEITNDQITRQYDPWQPTNLIREGWNTIKIVASGNAFSFYANGQLLGSRTISEAPARGRVGLGYEVDINGSDVQYDDVALTIK